MGPLQINLYRDNTLKYNKTVIVIFLNYKIKTQLYLILFIASPLTFRIPFIGSSTQRTRRLYTICALHHILPVNWFDRPELIGEKKNLETRLLRLSLYVVGRNCDARIKCTQTAAFRKKKKHKVNVLITHGRPDQSPQRSNDRWAARRNLSLIVCWSMLTWRA